MISLSHLACEMGSCGRSRFQLSHPAFCYSQARLKFPIDYPYSPPAFRFLTKMWHPNIYEVSRIPALHTQASQRICLTFSSHTHAFLHIRLNRYMPSCIPASHTAPWALCPC
jgi:hypothetical protein